MTDHAQTYINYHLGPDIVDDFIRLEGVDAIVFAEVHGITLSRYADPKPGGEIERDGVTVPEAIAIAADDPDLLYLDVGADSQDLLAAINSAWPRWEG